MKEVNTIFKAVFLKRLSCVIWWKSYERGLALKGQTLKKKKIVGNKAKTCAYQGVRNVRFSENFGKHPF